jgi:hypothetical protein
VSRSFLAGPQPLGLGGSPPSAKWVGVHSTIEFGGAIYRPEDSMKRLKQLIAKLRAATGMKFAAAATQPE